MAAAVGLLNVALAATSHAQDQGLDDLSLEELLNVTVISVSKRETPRIRSATAIDVITQDDIRRLGITTLAEALRWVPGMQVGRIDAQKWAVSARGFQSIFADKLLVLIDGRTIYEPFFSGVSWGKHDLVFEDLDRIEVIRGPGAALWGANAVNGVVNIITKSAAKTQGTLVSVTAGSEELPGVTVRYGGHSGDRLHYRVFLKYFDRQGLLDAAGDDAPHDWTGIRGGFRADWSGDTADAFMLQGDYYSNDTHETEDVALLAPPFTTRRELRRNSSGGFVLGRWSRTVSATSGLSLQGFVSHGDDARTTGALVGEIFDLEFLHHLAVARRQHVTWGLGYRLQADDLPAEGDLSFTPSSLTRHLFTAFVRDEITLSPDRLVLSLSSKFERNYFSGFEVQPGIRLLWTPAPNQALWAAASRAVRTPDRAEVDARLTAAVQPTGPTTPPIAVTVFGNPELEAETLIAYELGWRIEPLRRLSFDLATYYNVYDDLTDFAMGPVFFEPSPPPPHLVQPLTATNSESGESYGAELAVRWDATPRWRWIGDYTWLHIRFLDGSFEFDSAEDQVRLRSYLSLRGGWELNGAVQYTGSLRNQPIPAYTRLDLGLVWRPTPALELGLWGQNLLEHRHAEAINQFLSTFRGEVPRAVSSRLTWRF